MRILTDKEKLYNEQRKNKALTAKILRLEALLAYVSMMTDTELPSKEEEADEQAQPEV